MIIGIESGGKKRDYFLSKRLEYLDALRFLAAFSVVLNHFFVDYGLPEHIKQVFTNSPLHIIWDGFAAVSLFFVLSGFVLSRGFFSFAGGECLSKFSFIIFFIKRSARIWLPYICVALGTLFLKQHLFFDFPTIPYHADFHRSFWRWDFSGQNLLSELNLLNIAKLHHLIPPAWTLSIELVLSFFVPLAAFVAKQNAAYLFCITLVFIFLLKAPLYSFHFMLGVLLAKFYSQLYELLYWRSYTVKIIVLAFGLLLYTFRFSLPVYFPEYIPQKFTWYITASGSALILLSVMTSNVLKSILNKKFFVLLGRISYSIYLCHFAILLCLLPLTLFLLNYIGIREWLVSWVCGLFIMSFLTIVVASLIYIFIEKPSIKLGKIISYKLNQFLMKNITHA